MPGFCNVQQKESDVRHEQAKVHHFQQQAFADKKNQNSNTQTSFEVSGGDSSVVERRVSGRKVADSEFDYQTGISKQSYFCLEKLFENLPCSNNRYLRCIRSNSFHVSAPCRVSVPDDIVQYPCMQRKAQMRILIRKFSD